MGLARRTALVFSLVVPSAIACGAGAAVAPTPSDTLVITITGVNGSDSFAPNPSTAPPGQAIVWRNEDFVEHRIVFDDGELDTGVLAPRTSSPRLPLVQPGRYHCAIHPSMVGTIQPPSR